MKAMSALLDDIVHLAENDQNPLPNLLRKCLRLASELKIERLKTWANQELNGYEGCKVEEIPKYRKVQAHAYGSFAGSFHAWCNKHIIIPAVMDKKHQRYAEMVDIIQSVSALNDLVKMDTTQTVLTAHWSPNMVAFYSDKLWPGWICHDAWQEIPKSTLVEVLDSVRNITLGMALEIKEELGTSYDDLNKIKPEQAERAKTVVINNLGGNVALGDIDASGQTVIIAGDRKTLDAALAKVGMDAADLDQLTEAIETDKTKRSNDKVIEWIKSRASKVMTGGVKVGVGVGQQLLTEFLMHHYGLKK
jgi:AbiTii